MARVIIKITVEEEFRENVRHYARKTNRGISEFLIEAAQQHMNRYRHDQAATIDKRILNMIKELEDLFPTDSPEEQTDP